MADDMDDDYEDDADDEGSSQPQKSKKKLILVILLGLLLLVGGLGGAYFAGLADPVVAMLGGGGGEGESAAPAEGGDNGVPGEIKAAVFYDLPEMLVDLNTDGRKRTFLKIRVSLELANAMDVAQVETVMPRIIDNFQVYLRELRLEDLQGAEGVYRLREELLVRVNQAVTPARVEDVLFKEMLIQ